MQVSNKTAKRLTQILILIILGAGALMVIFIVGRMAIVADDYLPPTIDPLVPSLDFSVTVTEDRYAVISGTTDLPEGTLLNIGIDEEKGNYYGQDTVTVVDGTFQSERIGPDGGLNYGPYTIEILMAPEIEQPELVRERIGPGGVNLVGNLIIQGENGGVLRMEARFEVVRPAPVLRDCTGQGIGMIMVDYANGFELTLVGAYKTTSAFGIEPTVPANKDYGNEFVFVEFTYKNLGEDQRFVSYVDFVLFVNEEFALTDINTPYIYYPDSRFSALGEAKEYGFFGLNEVPPGESFTGKIAYMVPDIAHKFVFSSNANTCIAQGTMLQCFSDHPNFEFND